MGEDIVCAICGKELKEDFVIVEKNGQKLWICSHHPRPDKKD